MGLKNTRLFRAILEAANVCAPDLQVVGGLALDGPETESLPYRIATGTLRTFMNEGIYLVSANILGYQQT